MCHNVAPVLVPPATQSVLSGATTRPFAEPPPALTSCVEPPGPKVASGEPSGPYRASSTSCPELEDPVPATTIPSSDPGPASCWIPTALPVTLDSPVSVVTTALPELKVVSTAPADVNRRSANPFVVLNSVSPAVPA